MSVPSVKFGFGWPATMLSFEKSYIISGGWPVFLFISRHNFLPPYTRLQNLSSRAKSLRCSFSNKC